MSARFENPDLVEIRQYNRDAERAAAREREEQARREAAQRPVDRSAVTTIHGTPVEQVRAEHAAEPVGQHRDYIVLTAEERAKGFVRPVRRSYRHVGVRPHFPLRELTPQERVRHPGFSADVKFEEYPESMRPRVGRFWSAADLVAGCGTVTTMGQALAETYARDPRFYGATFCVGCNKHLPVGADGEFVWEGTEERVGT